MQARDPAWGDPRTRSPMSYIYKMLSAEDVPGMVQFFHICERDKKRILPSNPFLRAWAVRELDAKNRAIRDPAVRPQIPARQGITCRFQNRDFSDFCQFRSTENRVSEVFQARKTAKRQKNGNYASHTEGPETTTITCTLSDWSILSPENMVPAFSKATDQIQAFIACPS